MSFDPEISAYDLLSSLFSNILQYQFSDFGTNQSLILQILSTAIEEPKKLAYDFVSSISNTKKYFSAREDEEKLSQKSQLLFLNLENLFFNIYSKLRTSETVKLQESLYNSHPSISFSILNLDTTKQTINHTKFTTFLQCLLGDQSFFDNLLALIPKTTKPQLSQQVAFQVKNFISTLEYILDKEGLDPSILFSKTSKFEQYLRIAPEKLPIKESIREINDVIFSGNVQKLVKLISSQKDRQAFETSLLRVYNYYRRNVKNPKKFDQNAENGQEIFQKCVSTYVNSKARAGKDSLFRENRSTEPLLDFILSYMSFYFLPVLRAFDQYVEKYLLPLASLDTADFYTNFNVQGLQQGKQFLESLAVEFKDFLRRLYSAITSAGFNDSLSASAPVKTLIFLRFFLNPEIRNLIQRQDTVTKQSQDNFMKVTNYFKDLFYENSLKKYSYIPEFSQAYHQLNTIFDDIVLKRKAFKAEVVIPNYLKFYLTKPLLRYDYTIIKQTLDDQNARDYSEDFEDDSFYDEKLERGSEQPQPKAPINNIQANITKPPEKASTNALKKILDGEESSGSIDEEFLHKPNKEVKKEESKEDEYPPGRTKEIPWQAEQRNLNLSGQGSQSQSQLKKEDLKKPGSSFYRDEEDSVEEIVNRSIKVQKPQEDLSRNRVSQVEVPQPQQDFSLRNNRVSSQLEVPQQTRGGPNDSRRLEGSRLGASMLGREEESIIERMERENELKLSRAEKEFNQEKVVLMNRLGVLEEKYSLLLETIGTISPGKKKVENKENRREYEEENSLGSGNYEEKKRFKKDDSFYQLHKEIMHDRDEALQAEVDYVMHKKINFPGGELQF